ncbi:molybdopterin converting factor, subunit 2 protein [Cardiosporidium cionae]|uniref:Molybdopterin converting factor, subunit 2 protein n=1 Tax=Cardiosporidium cionae TaxID=476202 RepID=A0ABQ7JF45_9APIC|nr:molybdopterin converting factor, subunit 2 protein [Cardiosporidium cionae]|eukprot:KAF8822653.1 molybdopterin converting factor, subunit 2 protein [Cardiosporidium cionae]
MKSAPPVNLEPFVLSNYLKMGIEDRISVAFRDSPLDISHILRQIASPQCGGTSLFIGSTRENSRGKLVLKLYYEAYQNMATRIIRSFCDGVLKSFPGIVKIAIVHKLGDCMVGEHGIIIGVSAEHRHDAISACHSLIDQIKRSAPIWKKEFYEDGSAWLENSEWQNNTCT